MEYNTIIIIGYSGHAYVVCDILLMNDYDIVGYCEKEPKEQNPYSLEYLGNEQGTDFKKHKVFAAIGDNQIREKIFLSLEDKVDFGNAFHPRATIGSYVRFETGIVLGPNTVVNAMASLGKGVIINSGSIVEHECQIGAFAHIAPGATLAGNVTVGERTFIGANAVVKQGVNIGNDVIIGAGSVIIKDIPDNVTVVGNPGKVIKSNINL